LIILTISTTRIEIGSTSANTCIELSRRAAYAIHHIVHIASVDVVIRRHYSGRAIGCIVTIVRSNASALLLLLLLLPSGVITGAASTGKGILLNKSNRGNHNKNCKNKLFH
jgi:hypothetical protein